MECVKNTQERSDNMKIDSLEGIILTETNYGESSKILNVFTKKYGVIGVMSKGCKKTP